MKYVCLIMIISLLSGCSDTPYCIKVDPGQTVFGVQSIGEDCFAYTELSGHITCHGGKVINK